MPDPILPDPKILEIVENILHYKHLMDAYRFNKDIDINQVRKDYAQTLSLFYDPIQNFPLTTKKLNTELTGAKVKIEEKLVEELKKVKREMDQLISKGKERGYNFFSNLTPMGDFLKMHKEFEELNQKIIDLESKLKIAGQINFSGNFHETEMKVLYSKHPIKYLEFMCDNQLKEIKADLATKITNARSVNDTPALGQLEVELNKPAIDLDQLKQLKIAIKDIPESKPIQMQIDQLINVTQIKATLLTKEPEAVKLHQFRQEIRHHNINSSFKQRIIDFFKSIFRKSENTNAQRVPHPEHQPPRPR